MVLISFLNNKILNRKKGSLTVEAAIVLPIFIFVILAIGFFIKVVNTHEIIQHAINETADDMASSSYIYYSTGLYKIETNIYEDLTERTSKLEEQADELERILSVIKNNNSQNSNQSQEQVHYNNVIEIINKVESMTETMKDGSDAVRDLFTLINEIKDQGISENIENIVAAGNLELYHYLKNQIGNMIMKEQLEKHLTADNGKSIEERLKELHIVMPEVNTSKHPSRLYGLDFSRSNYLFGNDQIDIVVMYKIDLPVPIDFIGEIPIIQRAAARAWLGGTNPSLILEKSNPEEDNLTEDKKDDKKSKIVYITRTGKRYHKGGCRHLRQSKIPARLDEILELENNRYTPCKHCYDY